MDLKFFIKTLLSIFKMSSVELRGHSREGRAKDLHSLRKELLQQQVEINKTKLK